MTDSPENRSDANTPGPVRDRRRAQPAEGGSHPGLGGVIDRRVWPVDRRNLRIGENGAPETAAAPAPEGTGFERRRGPGRRLSDFTRSAEEGELTKEQFLFLMAIESFKKSNGKTYPTWTDVLEVVRLLGYRKTMPMEIRLRNAEDWREAPTTPSNVRPQRWAERAKIDSERARQDHREAA